MVFRKASVIGKQFNYLKVLRESHRDKHRVYFYVCLCDCGRQVVVDISSLKRGSTKSCGCKSIDLIRKSKLIDLSGKKFGGWKVVSYSGNSRIGWKCVCVCGSIRTVRASALVSGTSVDCGHTRDKNNGERMSLLRGKKSPFYNPRLSDKDREVDRNLPEYRDWKRAVKRRDGYTCKKCNKGGRQVEAHHIYNYSQYPKLRLKLSNGVCLCKSCHNTFHAIYGRMKNTRKQFLEYLKMGGNNS